MRTAADMPDWLEPMAATLTQERFEAGGDWVFERKFDGYHVFDILWMNGRSVTGWPLEERRRLLDALPLAPPLHRVGLLDDADPWDLASPFTKAVSLPRLRTHWVTPQIVVQASFIEWTHNDKLRHPRLIGVRVDKDPREVVRDHV